MNIPEIVHFFITGLACGILACAIVVSFFMRPPE